MNCQTSTKNIVFSLNRTTAWNNTRLLKEEHGYTLSIFGLPFGIFLFFWMFMAYKKIYKIIREDNIRPTLIHAHKLTYEGIIAYLLSGKLGVPFLLSIRSADVHVLTYKKINIPLYRRIVRKARKIFFISPWAIKPMQNFLGKSTLNGNFEVLPNIVNKSLHHNASNSAGKNFITVFNFIVYKRKNIRRVIKAFDWVFKKYPGCKLDIVGGGPNKEKIIALINRSAHPENFSLKGEIKNSEVRKLYAGYAGFVLPSFAETFGLVFIEALSAGIPIIYSKNTGIDGYFNHLDVGVCVNHTSVVDIASAIEKIIEQNGEFKKNVQQMIASGYLDQFSANSVKEKYSRTVMQYLKPEPELV